MSKADLEVEPRAFLDGRAFRTPLFVIGSSGVDVVGKFGTALPSLVVDWVGAGRGRGSDVGKVGTGLEVGVSG